MEKLNRGDEHWQVFAPELLERILRMIDPGSTIKSFHLLIDGHLNSANRWATVSAYDTLLDLVRDRFRDSHVECFVSITAREILGPTPSQIWVKIREHFERKRDEFRVCVLLGSWVVQKGTRGRKATIRTMMLRRRWHSLSTSIV
jgi:hypothetical protein